MRRLLPALIVLLLVPTVGGVSFEIRDSSCQAGEEPLFSMSNLTNAHAAAPGVFEDHTGPYGINGRIVCGQDTGNARIAQTCQTVENSVMSFYDPDSGQSHLATDGQESEAKLCTDQLATSVWRRCPTGSEPIVSIYGPVEDHIAEPGHYSWQICGAIFENATLAYNFTLSGNTTFVNNEGEGAAGTTLNGDGPLYAITQNGTLMSGLVGDNTGPQQVRIEDRSGRSVVTHTIDQASSQQWFVPLTTGDQFDIERRLSLIESGTFLTQFNPNFAFTLADEVLIRVGLEFENIDITNSISLGPGLYTFNIQKVGETADGTPRVNISVQ